MACLKFKLQRNENLTFSGAYRAPNFANAYQFSMTNILQGTLGY